MKTSGLGRYLVFVALVATGCSDSHHSKHNTGSHPPDAGANSDGSASNLDGSSGGGGGGGSGSGTHHGSGGSAAKDGGSVNGGGADGGAADGAVALPPGSDCARFGDACTASGACCSGQCDAKTNTCVSSVEHCAAEGAGCSAPTDCCNLSCGKDGKCGSKACISDGEACSGDLECCGQSCVDGKCQALNTACKTGGNTCTDNTQCCSSLCTNGKCDIAASFCIQQGDLCARAADCCSGRCDIATGKTVGICGAPPAGASFCSGNEGTVCGDCNDCCSRLCAPYGPTGVKICQPASGCHVTGDFCRKDADCCGVEGTDLPGSGNVYCEKEPDSDLGICRNPMSCNPQGNVCHYKNYACGSSSARADCCGGLGSKSGVCQLDPLGVPRCNGLGDTCRKTGDSCASNDDCCDDAPCVPDDNGALHCHEPTCVASSGACTINGDCCPGTECVRPLGSTQGTCEPPPGGGTGGNGGSGGTTGGGGGTSGGGGGTSGGGGGAGGTGGPVCSEYGQTCNQNSDCCNSVPCTQGVCRVPLG